MLLVLWDVDGTLVRTAGHGRFAFEEAFRTVVGREPEPVDYAGRTDMQIVQRMLGGRPGDLPGSSRSWPPRSSSARRPWRPMGTPTAAFPRCSRLCTTATT